MLKDPPEMLLPPDREQVALAYKQKLDTEFTLHLKHISKERIFVKMPHLKNEVGWVNALCLTVAFGESFMYFSFQ